MVRNTFYIIICISCSLCYGTSQKNPSIPDPPLHDKEFREYLKIKKKECKKIYGRKYLSYAYECDRMSLTEKDKNDCYADIVELLDYLINYCLYQETHKDFLERFW